MRRVLARRGLDVVALPWLLARLLVGLGWIVALVAVDELRPGERTLQLDQGLFAWDAAYYRDIADGGYDAVAPEGLRFFPLLPLAARLLAIPLLGNVGLALVLLVQACALAAGVALHRLVAQDLGDRPLADRSVWLLTLFPPAVVFVLGYSEAPFVLFSLLAFLGFRQGRWWTAAGAGFLAGLTRPVGAVLALPAAIEAWRGGRRTGPAALAAVVAPVAGCGVYLAWVERTNGDWQLPLRLQNSEELRGGFANPVATVVDALQAAADRDWGEALHIPWVVLFLGLAVVALRRLPLSYGAYAVALLGIALAGHTLGSFERYGLAAFPLVIALGTLLPDRVERPALLACAAGLTGFTTLVFVGAFVP